MAGGEEQVHAQGKYSGQEACAEHLADVGVKVRAGDGGHQAGGGGGGGAPVPEVGSGDDNPRGGGRVHASRPGQSHEDDAHGAAHAVGGAQHIAEGPAEQEGRYQKEPGRHQPHALHNAEGDGAAAPPEAGDDADKQDDLDHNEALFALGPGHIPQLSGGVALPPAQEPEYSQAPQQGPGHGVPRCQGGGHHGEKEAEAECQHLSPSP